MNSVDIDLQVFSLDTIKRATYRLGAKLLIDIEVLEHQRVRIHVAIRPASAGSVLDPVALFQNAVVDEDLRERIGKQTEGTRALIVAHALSKTALLAREEEEAEFQDDPLNIASRRDSEA